MVNLAVDGLAESATTITDGISTNVPVIFVKKRDSYYFLVKRRKKSFIIIY